MRHSRNHPAGGQQQALASEHPRIAAEAEVTGDMGRHYPAMARAFLASLPNVRYILAVARHPADTTR